MKNNSIDVCHRLGKKPYSPIIIRFTTKHARFDFFNQGMKKLKGLTTADFDFTKLRKRGVIPPATPAVTRSGNKSSAADNPTAEHQPSFAVRDDDSLVYLQEHLTNYNRNLLKDTRAALKCTHQYYVYVKNGEIGVKLDENEKYTVITSTADYQRELLLAKNRKRNPAPT